MLRRGLKLTEMESLFDLRCNLLVFVKYALQNNYFYTTTRGDGNCLFYAVSYILFNDDSHARALRRMSVSVQTKHAEPVFDKLALFTEKKGRQRRGNKKKDGVYGDVEDLVALSICFGVMVEALTVTEGDRITKYWPSPDMEERVGAIFDRKIVVVLHMNSVHYEALIDKETDRQSLCCEDDVDGQNQSAELWSVALQEWLDSVQ